MSSDLTSEAVWRPSKGSIPKITPSNSRRRSISIRAIRPVPDFPVLFWLVLVSFVLLEYQNFAVFLTQTTGLAYFRFWFGFLSRLLFCKTMRSMHHALVLFYFFSWAHASEFEELDTFLGALIDTWRLRSPSIISVGDLPAICMRRQWLLCLSDGLGSSELAKHLNLTHQHRRLDGIILVGSQGHEKLLSELDKESSITLTSIYPVFLPTSYKKEIKLRLDSNVVFYGKEGAGSYNLFDIFAIKGGPLITLDIGKWDSSNGLLMEKHINRWDRRTDLEGASMVNVLAHNVGWSEVERDNKTGRIVRTFGYFQDMLFYITDRLNMTIENIEVGWTNKLLANGSWTGSMRSLVRKEADVATSGLGISLQRSGFIDYPMATDRQPLILHAAIPKGSSTNMWVYVSVFGLTQWMMYFALLILMAMGLYLINVLFDDESGMSFGTKRGSNSNYKLSSVFSGFGLVFLYNIQMGSHPTTKYIAARILTLTVSTITMLFFVFYTGDITAAMTSGPAKIPIKTFADVIAYDYQVVTGSGYFENILRTARPGSPMHEVYTTRFLGNMKNKDTALAYTLSDPKILHYDIYSLVNPRELVKQTFRLQMTDAVYGAGTVCLQKDSEFLQIFNHYIIKGHESGFLKRLFRVYHNDLFIKTVYEMVEPEPLGFNNVVFCFSCLAVGICLAITKAIFEFAMNKCKEQTEKGKWAISNSILRVEMEREEEGAGGRKQ